MIALFTTLTIAFAISLLFERNVISLFLDWKEKHSRKRRMKTPD
jgi:hypothetical protein